MKLVIIFLISLLFTCASTSNVQDTADLKARIEIIKDSLDKIDCSVQPNEKECIKSKKETAKVLDQAVTIVEKKDNTIIKKDEEIKDLQWYANIGEWVVWTIVGLIVFFLLWLLFRVIWRNRFLILNAVGVPVPSWLTKVSQLEKVE